VSAAAPAVEHQRPSIVGSDLSRFWSLTWTLATTDFKLRFYGSVLGYAWTLVRPFALFGVLWIVFAEIADLGANVKNYPAYILLSMTIFQFFRAIVDNALLSLVTRENLLRKIRFPRLVIPMAVTFGALFELALTLAAVAIFLFISGVFPGVGWLELAPLLAIVTLLGAGLGLLLSVLYVRFRDMAPIWDVIGQMLFYASPILYVASMVPEDYRELYMLNPIAVVLTQMRHSVIDPAAPDVVEAIGNGALLLIPLAFVLVTFVVGLWAFVHEAPKVAENL
jgi:ABC-2 type transport system permease protein